MGWSSYKNGALLTVAEESGFAALVTVDQNISSQQNMRNRAIALIVLVASTNRIGDLQPRAPDLLCALATLQAGQVLRFGAQASES